MWAGKSLSSLCRGFPSSIAEPKVGATRGTQCSTDRGCFGMIAEVDINWGISGLSTQKVPLKNDWSQHGHKPGCPMALGARDTWEGQQTLKWA